MKDDKKTLNEDLFRQRAQASGFKPDEIDFELERRRSSFSLAQTIAYKIAKAAPTALGLAGGIGGSIAGLGVGSIPGAAIGGFAGVAGGRALEDQLLRLAGVRTKQYGGESKGDISKSFSEVARGDVGKATKEGAITGATTLLLGGAGKLASKILKPTELATKFLEKTRSGSSVPEGWEKSLLKALEKNTNYQALGPKTTTYIAKNRGAGELAQAEIKSSLERLIEMTQGSGKGGLNTIYQTLPSIKNRLTGQYAGVGKQILDRVVREATSPYQSPLASKVASPLFQVVKKLQPEKTAVEGIKRGLGWAPWIAAGYPIMRKIAKGVGIQQD